MVMGTFGHVWAGNGGKGRCVQMQQRGFGGGGLESWWLRRWAARSDRLAGRGQGTAQANRGGSKGARGQNKVSTVSSAVGCTVDATVGWMESGAGRGHLTVAGRIWIWPCRQYRRYRQYRRAAAGAGAGRVGVGRTGLVEADGALLLKATSPMEGALVGTGAGLEPVPLDSTSPKLVRLYEYSKQVTQVLQKTCAMAYHDDCVDVRSPPCWPCWGSSLASRCRHASAACPSTPSTQPSTAAAWDARRRRVYAGPPAVAFADTYRLCAPLPSFAEEALRSPSPKRPRLQSAFTAPLLMHVCQEAFRLSQAAFRRPSQPPPQSIGLAPSPQEAALSC